MAEKENKNAVKAVEKKAKKDKKPNIFARMGKGIARFWRESVSELKKVAWMTKKDLRKSTLIVVVSVVVISIAIAIVDYLFTIGIQGLGQWL